MIKTLTSKQQRILGQIKEFQRTHNRMPSYKELADTLGYSSINSIQQFVKVLSDKKYIRLQKQQGIKELVTRNTVTIQTVNIPLVGRVACGTPILAAENIEAYIPIDKQLVKNKPDHFFFLTAQGDSMNRAGIEDKDLLLIESTSMANPGDIVLALIDDEATVKIFKPQKDYILLLPNSSNKKHQPIIVASNLKIQGIVRRVIKK